MSVECDVQKSGIFGTQAGGTVIARVRIPAKPCAS
jgi:hypothetical protein